MKTKILINRSLFSILIGILSILFITSCNTSDGHSGCQDPESENYDASATSDNGNCEYPYEKFEGTYTVYETYSTSSCGNGSDTYTTQIMKGANNHEIVITNLGGLPGIRFNVSNQTLTGIYQGNVPTGDGDMEFNEGSGTLNGNTIHLTYELSDLLGTGNCGYYDVTATFTKL